MALTEAEIKELSRILDKRIKNKERRPSLRTPAAKKARDPAAPCNVFPIRDCHSLPQIRWSRHYGESEVVDITDRLPPCRGRKNQVRTLKAIGARFEHFEGLKGEVGKSELETMRAIIGGHLHRSVMDTNRERESVESLFQDQWRILWNRWVQERDTRGEDPT